MLDLALNNNDIYLTNMKDLTIATDKEQFIQRLKIKFQFFYQEWFLDQDKGIDFYGSIFIKNYDINLINNIFKVTIMEEEASIQLQNFKLELIERKIYLNFILLSTYGEIVFNEVIL
jgi:hypothetical protein